MDLFWDLSKLQSVLKQGYGYYIFDYGTCTDTDFDRNAFLREKCSIFVCGFGPGEMNSTLDLIHSAFYNDVLYRFNFTPEEEQKEILNMMEEKAERTFFAGYCPDRSAAAIQSCLKRCCRWKTGSRKNRRRNDSSAGRQSVKGRKSQMHKFRKGLVKEVKEEIREQEEQERLHEKYKADA